MTTQAERMRPRALRRGTVLGLAGSLVALSGVMIAGGAASAADTISPSSGTVSGGTATTLTVQAAAPSATATSGQGNFVIGSDGNVYYNGALVTGLPAGVTAKSISATIDTYGTNYAGVVGSDGKWYASNSGAAFTNRLLPSGVTVKAVAGDYDALGSDGNIYVGGNPTTAATKLAGLPSGVTATSLVVGFAPGTNHHWAGVIGSDGNAYRQSSADTGAFTPSNLPSGVHATTVTSPGSSTSSGDYVVGSDGKVYFAGSLVSGLPAGVTAVSIDSAIDSSNETWLSVIGSDGNWYYSGGGSAFIKKALPSGVSMKTPLSTYFALGSDGNLYAGGTATNAPTKVAGLPVGVTATSGAAALGLSNNGESAAVIGSDGKEYMQTNGDGSTNLGLVSLPTRTVSSVKFGGTAATSTSQSGTQVTAKTPSHAAGPVDVVVNYSDGTSSTLSQAFTYTAPAAPGGLTVTGPNSSGDYTLSGTGADPTGTVTVTDANGNVVGTVTPASDGTWSVTVPAGTAAPLSITQTVNGSTSAPVTYDSAPLPVVAPAIGAGALAIGLLGFGAALWIRRRKASAVKLGL